jgi:hypothetical protein
MLGSKLSADSGAKTRLGFSAELSPSREGDSTGIGMSAINPRGVGTESPQTLLLFQTHSSVPLTRSCRSFVGHMSPPSTSARAYSADWVSQSLFSLVGLVD